MPYALTGQDQERRAADLNQFLKQNGGTGNYSAGTKLSGNYLDVPTDLVDTPMVIADGVFMNKSTHLNLMQQQQPGYTGVKDITPQQLATQNATANAPQTPAGMKNIGTAQAPMLIPIGSAADMAGQGKVEGAGLPQQTNTSIIGRQLGPTEYNGLLKDNKLAGVSQNDSKWQALFTKDANNNIYLKPPVQPQVQPIDNNPPTGSTGTPTITAPTAPAITQSFYTGVQTYSDQTKQALQASYQQQQNDTQKQLDMAQQQMQSAQAGEKGIADANYKSITDALAVQKQRIDDNYNANQNLIGEMDSLLTQGNALIQEQQNTTSLAAIKDPRIAKTMSDVTARTGVIQAVLAARNGQISVAESALSSTVSALNAATQDQLNYYKNIENYYSGKENTASADVKTFIAAKTAMLQNDMQQAQANAENLKKAMTNPDTALAYGEAGVTLNDTPAQIAQKMETYGYSKELKDLSNTMAKGGYSYLAPGQKVPAGMINEPQVDSKGVVHNYYKPMTAAQQKAQPGVVAYHTTYHGITTNFDARGNIISKTGTPTSSSSTPSPKTPKLTAEEKKFQTVLSGEQKKLAKGGSWATSWNYLHNLYPQATNAQLDGMLNKTKYYTQTGKSTASATLQ